MRLLSWIASIFLWVLAAQLSFAQGPPTEAASVQVQSVISSPSGLKATVILSHAKTMFVKIYGEDPTTGEYDIPFLPWTNIPLPTQLSATPNPVGGDIMMPVVVAQDSGKRYQMWVYVASSVDASGGSNSWVNSTPTLFHGFSPQITKSFSLKINPDSLTVSAKTDAVVTLTSSWIVGTQSLGEQFQMNHQDPTVDLKFTALGSPNAGSLPSIHVKLENPNTLQVQEADFALSVAVNDQTKKTVKDAQANPKKSSFSWSQLAETGVGAVLKYLTAGI